MRPDADYEKDRHRDGGVGDDGQLGRTGNWVKTISRIASAFVTRRSPFAPEPPIEPWPRCALVNASTSRGPV